MLPQALEVTHRIKDEGYRSDALRALAPHLPESLLPQALEVTRQIKDQYHSAKVFQGIADRLIQLSNSMSFWCEVLHTLSHLNRNNLLQTMPELRPFIVNLGGEEALQEVIREMREVCRHWR